MTASSRWATSRWAQTALLVAYAAMAAWFRVDTTLPAHAMWARWAVPAYLVALLVSPLPGVGRHAMLVAFAGACLAPLAGMIVIGLAQPEVGVLVDGARHLLESGTPYVSQPMSLDEVRPYFPLLFLFGMPRALGASGVLGDPRLWILTVGAVFLWALRVTLPAQSSRSTTRGSATWGPAGSTIALLAFPVVSLNLAVSAIDIPIVAALGWSFVELSRGRLAYAGLATTTALLMKPTAALVVLVVVTGLCRRKVRGWQRYAGWSLTPALVVVLAVCSVDAAGFAFSALRFPLGLTEIASPAQSPFPGVLLARVDGGRTAAVALVVVVTSVVAGLSWRRPPRGVRALARRSAVLLCLVILLAPNSRVGYFVVPIALWAVSARLPRQEWQRPIERQRIPG